MRLINLLFLTPRREKNFIGYNNYKFDDKGDLIY